MDYLVYFGDNKPRREIVEAKMKEMGYLKDDVIPGAYRYQPLAGKVFVLDAGHGGSDPGAVDGKDDDNLYSEEADMNLEYAIAFGERLIELGAFVIYTRTENVFVPITERVRLANNEPIVNAFISMHFNASATNKAARGMEVLAYKEGGEGYRLATAIRDAAKATGIPIFNSGLSIRPDLGVLRLTKMPAVLIETGFITTPEEEKLLRSVTYRRVIVEAAVKGVLNWLK